jgi:hypothetical protein
MDLADFHTAMERMFDAAGFGLNADNEDACPTDVAMENASAQRTIINISATGENKGWLAPVNIDDVLMMLAVDTGAGMTIVNKSKVLSFMDALDLEPSPFEFHTANGELLEGVGQFYYTLQLGPIVLENCITVADVVEDGLLGMDFLAATDAWVGLRDGQLHMKQNGEEITWPLRREDQTARYVAMPIQSVIVDPMSLALVPCTVKGPSGEDENRPMGTIMAEPIRRRVPATLVEMDGEVLTSIMNFGTRTLHIGSDTPWRTLTQCRRFLVCRRFPPV